MANFNYLKYSSAKSQAVRLPASRSEESLSRNVDSLTFRPYQRNAFENKSNGIEIWLWGRQTGKSFTLAAWAVDRLIQNPGRLVTILSNSRSNGLELNLKCAEICRAFEVAYDQSGVLVDDLNSYTESRSATIPITSNIRRTCDSLSIQTFQYETRIALNGKTGRIKVLPANPRTARGFSGDLILDEFAFHEDSESIWSAAEPILAANPDYLCRVASTPNGRHNMFYRLATDPNIPKRFVPRSLAWKQGLGIYDTITRAPITPHEARYRALDKRAYDQNYECVFESENMPLIGQHLISLAEDNSVGLICSGDWCPQVISWLQGNPFSAELLGESEVRPSSTSGEPLKRNLYVGIDVGRKRDLTVITLLEKADVLVVRAILRLCDLPLPAQQSRLNLVCHSKRFAGALMDMSGIGLGLFEYAKKEFGPAIRGINFASSLRITPVTGLRASFAPGAVEKAAAPDVLAFRLLQAYEDRRLRHPVDAQLREDLRTPERLREASGRCSIHTPRGASGHADHFWSFALAVEAAHQLPEIYIHVVPRKNPFMRIDRKRLM